MIFVVNNFVTSRSLLQVVVRSDRSNYSLGSRIPLVELCLADKANLFVLSTFNRTAASLSLRFQCFGFLHILGLITPYFAHRAVCLIVQFDNRLPICCYSNMFSAFVVCIKVTYSINSVIFFRNVRISVNPILFRGRRYKKNQN